MAKKKNKPANAKKKLDSLLAKMKKKQAQIERKSKQLKALKSRVAKFVAQNPELQLPPIAAPKTASRRRKKVTQ